MADKTKRDVTIIQASFRETFRHACQQTTAEEVQQWLYAHEREMPIGVRALFFAAANAVVNWGVYEDAKGSAE